MTNAEGRAMRRRERREFVIGYKQERGCASCGYNRCVEALDFHHREGVEKLELIPEMVDKVRAWPRLLAEIEKCEILCANCHREQTFYGESSNR